MLLEVARFLFSNYQYGLHRKLKIKPCLKLNNTSDSLDFASAQREIFGSIKDGRLALQMELTRD
jgi:hypothetical protein